MPLRDFAERYPRLVARLCQARRADRVAHAYLVSGDQPQRLEAVARAWVGVCICQAPTADGDACGTCDNCRALAGGYYPYLHELRPKSRSRQILVDDIRELEHYLYLTSEGQRKVGLVYDAERMNDEAQNAFLKTLEEPAARTMLVLLTGQPMALLPTIRSRCQALALFDNRVTYDFPRRDEFCRLLPGLRRQQGALAALQLATQLLTLLGQLQDEAEQEGKRFLAEMKVAAERTAERTKKDLEEEAKTISASAYLSRRDAFLSALHAWFAHELLRAHGVPPTLYPNPELYAPLGPKGPGPAVSIVEAERNLELVEELLESLVFMVDQALAIQDFCQQVCRKT